LNAFKVAIHYSFTKFCIYCFSLWYEFFVHYAMRVEKNYRRGLDPGPLEFQFLWPRECFTNLLRTLSLCFEVIGKTRGPCPIKILLKKFLSASAIAIMSWQDVTRSSLCSGVKECGTKRAHFLFPKSSLRIWRTMVLGMFKRFCHHYFCDSMVIFDQISNSSNVYLSSRRF
jgi:hypothetical protein